MIELLKQKQTMMMTLRLALKIGDDEKVNSIIEELRTLLREEQNLRNNQKNK